MSSEPRRSSSERKTSGNQGGGTKNIETNLERLGLLGHEEKRHRSRRKVVGFQHPVSDKSLSPPHFSELSQLCCGLKSDLYRFSSTGHRPPSRTPSRTSRNSQYSNNSQDSKSGVPKSRKGMTGVLDMERSRTRKDRNFIGSECTVCEEKLEYTLRGERILQLSCGHVAHEACFVEYIRESESQYCPTCNAPLGLDSSRGGNVLDIGELPCTTLCNTTNISSEKLSNIMRTNSGLDQGNYDRNTSASPAPWDTRPSEQPSLSREGTLRAQIAQVQEGSIGVPSRSNSLTQRHIRNDSAGTGMNSIPEYGDATNSNTRKHDYDVQSMETSLGSPRGAVRNPIPAPSVTVRSEFPTLTRSRQQQSLTCLITIEIPEGKWRPSPEDVRSLPSMMGGTASNVGDYSSIRSPGIAPRNIGRFNTQTNLDEVTEELHSRVDHWHGLDFSRFGKLRLHGHIRVGKDRGAWQDLDCYLFSEMLICVKEKRVSKTVAYDGPSSAQPEKPRCTLKGSILIGKHLKEVETFLGKLNPPLSFWFSLTLNRGEHPHTELVGE
jgi:hypothetical protein